MNQNTVLNQNQLEVVRFIEDEHRINEIVEELIDIKTMEEIQQITEPMFREIAYDIAETLQVSKEEGVIIYNNYISMMEKVAQLLLMRE